MAESNLITIDDLKKETGITDDQLEERCNLEHLKKIVDYVESYLQFATKFNMPPNYISSISQDILTFWQKTEKVFLWWHENCKDSTYRNFTKICIDLKVGNIARKILRLRVEVSSPQSQTVATQTDEQLYVKVSSPPEMQRSSSSQTMIAQTNETELPEQKERGFDCPYCRKCTMESYYMKGCPKAEGKTLFPYLNLEALSKHEQYVLEQRFYEETRDITRAFAHIDDYILSNHQDLQVSVVRFKTLIHNSLEVSKNDPEIKKANTIPEIYAALAPNKSFINCNILIDIVDMYGSSEMKRKMDEYLAKLDKFCERSAFEIPARCLSTSFTLDESKYKWEILSVKVSCGSRLRDAVLARVDMASIFGIGRSVFLILGIDKGCMCVRFLVSKKVFLKYFPPSASQLAALKEAGIEIITVPTHFKRSASEGDLTLLSTASAVLGDDHDSGPVDDSKISAKRVAKYQHLKANKRSIKMVTLRNWRVWLKKNIQHLRQDPGHMVPLLLWYCIDECDTDFGWTATHGFAASSDSLGMEIMYAFFEFLRKCNREIQLLTKDKDGDIPVQCAIRSKASKHVIERLIDVKNINDLLCSRNKKNQNPLLTAFDESHWEAVEVILGKCIEHNLLSQFTGVRAPPGRKYNTILHKAFERRNVEYFEIFLRVCNDKGITGEELTAAVLVSNRRNVTPWYFAIRFLNIEELRMVLIYVNDSGLDINSLYIDKDTKSTMLHDAYRIQKPDYCYVLEEYGATHQQDSKGLFPRDRNRQIQGQTEEATAGTSVEGDSVNESRFDFGTIFKVPELERADYSEEGIHLDMQSSCLSSSYDHQIQKPQLEEEEAVAMSIESDPKSKFEIGIGNIIDEPIITKDMTRLKSLLPLPKNVSKGDLTSLNTASSILGDSDSGPLDSTSEQSIARYQPTNRSKIKRSIKTGTIRNWTRWLEENLTQLTEDPDRNVPLLLQHLIDERDTDFGWTATHGFVASSKSLGNEVMNALFKFLKRLNRESQLLTKDKDGDIPVQSAIRSKASKDVIERLIDVENIEELLCSHNVKNQSPLFSAFDESHWEAVEVILGKCIEHNLLSELTGVRAPPGQKHNTILHKAFERGNTEYFKIFLRVCNDKGITREELTAAVLVSNRRNVTPWYYAIRFLKIKALKTVLKKVNNSGLNIDFLYTDTRTRSTMLHDAYRNQNHKRCHILEAEYGATQQRDSKGLLPRDRYHQIQGHGHAEDNAANVDGDSVSESGETSSTGSYEHKEKFPSGTSNSSTPPGSSMTPIDMLSTPVELHDHT